MTSPEVPRRTVRVPEDDWRAAKAAAALEGLTISEVIRKALCGYVLDRKHPTRLVEDGSPVLTVEEPPTAVYPNHVDADGITWYWGVPGKGPV
jgi:hypothetical protein